MTEPLLTIGLDLGVGEIDQITPLPGTWDAGVAFLRLTFGTHYHEGDTVLTVPLAAVSAALTTRLKELWQQGASLRLTLTCEEDLPVPTP